MLIHGIPIVLYDKVRTGTDDFNRPIYTTEPVTVENVIVEPMTDTEILETFNLTGRRATYRLCLPKGDAHEWVDRTVEFFGHQWRTIGEPLEWIEDMVPLAWNKKVRVERINGEG